MHPHHTKSKSISYARPCYSRRLLISQCNLCDVRPTRVYMLASSNRCLHFALTYIVDTTSIRTYLRQLFLSTLRGCAITIARFNTHIAHVYQCMLSRQSHLNIYPQDRLFPQTKHSANGSMWDTISKLATHRFQHFTTNKQFQPVSDLYRRDFQLAYTYLRMLTSSSH